MRGSSEPNKLTPLHAPAVPTRLPPLLTSVEILELTRIDAVVSLQRWWKHHRRRNRKRVAEFSDQLLAYAQSLIKQKRQARIRAKIRDIAIHIVFLYVYTVSCHHGYSHERLYRLVSATTHEYQERPFSHSSLDGLDTNTKTFHGIASHSDLYAWLRGPFISLSYASFSSATATSSRSSSSTASLLLTNRVVGGIRIGQLRVQQRNCTARVSTYYPTALMEDTTSTSSEDLYCYGSQQGDFTTDDESTDQINGLFPFSGLNGTDTVSERSEIFSSMASSNALTLPAPAFSVVLPRGNATQALQIVQWLETQSYVDVHTRAVVVDLNLVNVMLRYVVALRFLIEFPAGGGAIATIHVSTAPLTKSFLVSLDDAWWTACNLATVVLYVYFFGSEIALHTTRRRRHQHSTILTARSTPSDKVQRSWSNRNGSVLRILSLALYVVVWLLRLFTLLKLPTRFPVATNGAAVAASEYVRLRPFAEAFRVSQAVLGVNTCLCWWIMLLLLRVLSHVDLFLRTVEHARARLATLLLSLAVLLYGYASAFLVTVGATSSRFRSIPQAIATLVLLLFGSSSREEPRATNSASGYSTMELLLFAGFLLLNVFVVSNLFLVVLWDAFRRASEDVEQLQNASDQFNLPLETWYYSAAVVTRLKTQLYGTCTRLIPKRLAAASTSSDKSKRLSVVRVISSAQVLTKSKKILTDQVDALSGLGEQLARNVAAGLGERDAEQLTDQPDGSSTVRRRRRQNFSSSTTTSTEPATKLLQGMVLQLAIQNDHLLRSLEEVRRELKQSSSANGPSSSMDSGGSISGRTASDRKLRNRTFALRRANPTPNENKTTENNSDDDDDDSEDQELDELEDGDGGDIRVVESVAELTAIQSI